MAALIACVYLLLRKGNAFAADVTSPVLLRRWAAAFFAVTFLGHVWWLLFYIYSTVIHSVVYVVLCGLDCMVLLPTITGMLLAMLQDRKRPVWPVAVATIPYAALLGLNIVYPDSHFVHIAIAYFLFFFVGWWFYRRRPERVGTGFFFGLCIFLIFTFRFFIEYTKEVQVSFENGMIFNMGQLLSVPFILLGGWFIWKGRRDSKKSIG